ncbi:hypothetical protein MKW98_028207 [Papaver atlanticum]|uniref:Ninja-family protein n=1 Tax=Papaver atlanticum TaxID=357466 RepID=A0AAD4SVZ9_9MAGN|nr:hypothetical protein MKW98_028207 [Papaver atlanticum]
MEIIEGNEEEIELSLGLSIGGRSFKKFEKPNQEKSSLSFDMKFLENDNGLDLEKRKREIHKMRRQEARKKREIKKSGGREKLMNRAEQEDEDEDEQTSSFKKLKPENEEEKGLYPVMLPSMQYGYQQHHQSLLNPFSNGFGFPAAYQMMPFWVPPPPPPPPTSTFSSSPETPVVVDDKNVVQPIVCKPFIRAFQISDSTAMDKISDDGVKTRDSDSCGSAVISDHQISSQFDNDTSTTRSAQSPPLNQPQLHESNNVQQVQSENITTHHPPQILTLGIKQDTPNFNKIIATQSNLSCSKSAEEPILVSNSVPIIINTSKTEFPPQNLPPLQQLKCANGDSHKPPIPRIPHQSKGSNEDCNKKPPLPLSPKKVVADHVETNQLKKVTTTNEEETNKSPKAAAQVRQIKSLPKMPCVSTVGDGPNGKTITGFLYRYTNAEVSIVCVCHGSSFSPAEFVKHAGRTDVSQPLKHITVLPSPFG